jgi:hypothetical protein
MKVQHFVLPALALGAAAALLPLGENAVGFSTIGGSLSLSQRDVRVYDNFTDTTANNNTTPHPMFPGYTGIEMATWKSGVEWGSGAHGDGTGDTTQALLGNGGANFDVSWQGNATGIGGINDNIHSEIAGSNGGVLAYTETPISDGWRIRYYEGWTWHDGPGNVTSGIDYQGVATHEYGHALGLGHSDVGGATMYPSISGTGVTARSIEADDIAGVQFIYGVKSASKPTITSASASGGVVTINGTNFSGSGNEVWFTQANNTTGNVLKVTGVTSNGTLITVSVPAGAGPGDVLVRNSGTGNANLSNAWPLDPGSGGTCTTGNSFCTAKLSSSGCLPSMVSNGGLPSLANQGAFSIFTNGMEAAQNGLSFFGTTGQQAVAFNGGTLCVAGTLYRLNVKNTGGASACTGSFSYSLAEITAHPSGGPLVLAGVNVEVQTWFRDPPDPFTVGLSNAYHFTACP